jgi:hypothetical protein
MIQNITLPEINLPIRFRVKPGELSFGYRDVPLDSTHQGYFDGNQWVSEKLVGENIGRVKLYRTGQIEMWQYD